jgi:hypothetical protein
MKKSFTIKSIMLGLLIIFFTISNLHAQITPADPQKENNQTADVQEKPAEPKVEGSPYQTPDPPQPKVTRKELMRQVALDILQVLLTPRDKTPKQRLRGDEINLCNIPNYKGRCGFYQFTNSDFPSSNNSCGQAAMATAMWAVGIKSVFPTDKQLASSVWRTAPPKITLGNLIQLQPSLGSDWRQLNYGLDQYKKYGIQYAWINGVTEIKKYLSMQLPVIIMLDCGTLPQFDYKWWTGHWVTALAYDANYIYVSNFKDNKMTWKQLEDGYKNGTLAIGHGTSGRACVVWK